jgi:DNA anti-recombination protein RmuC
MNNELDEQLEKRFKIFGEELYQLNEKLNKGFGNFNEQFNIFGQQLNEKFDKRFNIFDQRLDQLNKKLDEHGRLMRAGFKNLSGNLVLKGNCLTY